MLFFIIKTKLNDFANEILFIKKKFILFYSFYFYIKK